MMLPFQTALEGGGQGLAHRTVLEALDEGGEEALDHELLGLGLAQAAAAQIEELLGVDLSDSRRVGAADVVGLDLQPRNRVGVRPLGDQQVARLLERVGLLGAGVDDDVALPDRARPSLQHAAEREVGGRVRRRVLLGRVEVDVLAAVRGVGTSHTGVRTLAFKAGLHQDVT